MRRVELCAVAALVLLVGQFPLVAYAETATVVKPPELNITPDAPPEVKGFFSRFLGFIIFIAWMLFLGGLIWTGIQFYQGDKEAPQKLRNVLIGGFIITFALTIAYFLFG
ncbi:hypothetical protein Pyrde_0727 [Pyrodictium delaneyi]|uniref:Uncharacterized protein n=1 Tax=Pyrodictium delaneyi TaxID=1273541 RepID=A0A0N7JCZ6_9CREN|nr:hypothetical protein [Pyrodictium delaneyi]ALL00777.1 hypothetical protein Pyrde_0727 [Pyrodictium delaneyi]